MPRTVHVRSTYATPSGWPSRTSSLSRTPRPKRVASGSRSRSLRGRSPSQVATQLYHCVLGSTRGWRRRLGPGLTRPEAPASTSGFRSISARLGAGKRALALAVALDFSRLRRRYVDRLLGRQSVVAGSGVVEDAALLWAFQRQQWVELANHDPRVPRAAFGAELDRQLEMVQPRSRGVQPGRVGRAVAEAAVQRGAARRQAEAEIIRQHQLWYCLCHSGPPPLPLWLLTAWPGGAAWCHAALGRGLVVVWLYERPGLAFPYPLRVHPVRCLPAAWLHSSVATSKPLL
eukprot:COSAG04_NODE_2939_length_3368_cov_3.662894_3_plen_288_part_00